MLLLGEIHTIQYQAHVRQLLLGIQSVDHAETCLCGIVCTTNIDTEVCQSAELQAIVNQSYRCCIKHDVVVMVLQFLDDGIEAWTSHQQVEVAVDARRENLLLDILPSVVLVNHQVGDTSMMVVDFEQLCQTRLTDIQTYYDDLLAQQSQRDGYVRGNECLTLTRG